MQPVNDDMDDLFRRAAQNYPLNTGAGSFDKIQQRIEAAEGAKPAEQQKQKRRYIWWIWLPVVLIFLLLFQQFHYRKNSVFPVITLHSGNDINNLSDSSKKPFSSLQNSTTLKNRADSETLAGKGSANIPAMAESNTEKNYTKPDNNRKLKKYILQNKIPDGTQPGQHFNRTNSKEIIATNNDPNKQSIAVTEKNNGQRKQKNSATNSDENAVKQKVVSTVFSKKNTYQANSKSGMDINNLNADSTKSNTTQKTIPPPNNIAKKPDTSSASIAKLSAAKDSINKTDSAEKRLSKSAIAKRHYLYAGIAAGIDESAVKSTWFSGAGYNFGLVAGYRFGRHWAVESGLLKAYKKYYSPGRYVSVDKLALPMHSEVVSVEGNCSIIEWPLNLQYHFAATQKHEWYAAAGTVSYFVKKEYYEYDYKRYNMEYSGAKEYANSSKNLFSVLQLSMGYQWQIKKYSSLRIEPYIKLPLSGIGIASLPISSTGINVGYMLPIR